MLEDAIEEQTRPDIDPESGAEGEARFEARCPDREEFIVAYQAFVQEDTLVLPAHPRLTVGDECDFSIGLRGGGSPLLRGRCHGLEALSETRGLDRVSKAVRVRVLVLDEGCRDLHQRLVARSRFRGSAGFRLPRLELLLQVPFSRPPAPAAPVRLTARAAGRPRPVVPLRPEARKPPLPARSPVAPSPPLETRAAAFALPVLEAEPDRTPESARTRLLRELRDYILRWLGRHRRLIVAGTLGFVLGLAARGEPQPRRLPEVAAGPTLPQPVDPSPAPVAPAVPAPPPPTPPEPTPAAATASTEPAVAPPRTPPRRHRRGAHRLRHTRRGRGHLRG